MNLTKQLSAPQSALRRIFKRFQASRLVWPIAATACVLSAVCPMSASAQTTLKPFQVRVEWPAGVAGTMLLTNNNLRIATNGASTFDSTGTNWVIPSVSVSIGAAPAGVTATLTDSGGNTVTTIPVNLNTGNSAMNTNLIVKLVFDGSQASGITTLNINMIGGLTNGYFPLVLEIGKIWNGSANAATAGIGNWSDPTKWLGGAPGLGDCVVFTDLGTQTNSLYWTGAATNLLVNSLVDVSTTIASLRFAQTNGTAVTGSPNTNFHNLFINPGITLAINGIGGFSMLKDYTYANTKMNVTITGTNGFLIQTNENANFSLLADGATASVLDMSGLGNLRLNVNEVSVGDILSYPNYTNLIANLYNPGSTFGGSRPSKCLPTWKMALTNNVRAVYVDPYHYANSLSRSYALELGRNETTGGSSGNDFVMSMGISNAFFFDGVCVAGYAALGSVLNFQYSNSFASFRNTNGGRMSVFACGDAAGSSATAALANNTKCGNSGFGVDFTKGTVDILVDRFYMSMDRGYTTGNGICQATLGMAGGTIDVNSAFIAYQASGNQTNQDSCTATLTVTNKGVFRVNGNLALGYTTASPGDPSTPASTKGVINIGPGGTLMASNVTVGGTTKASTGNAINLTGNASLIVLNGIADATPYGALGTLSFAGGNNTIKLFVDGSNPAALIYTTNFTATGTGNKLVIGGVKNLIYPADVVIVQGAGAAISATVFDGGVTMPSGLGLSGTLSTSATNTINLHIINRLPNTLVWRGAADGAGTADWDYTTKNWLDQKTGLTTNYDNSDIVAFDDMPGYATNINVAGGLVLTPSIVNMTNNILYYTFLDGGNQVVGGPALNKYGTGTVEVDATTTFSVQVNQGVLTGISSGNIGNVSVAAGAVMNYSGTIGGSVSSSGTTTISGNLVGTMTVLAGLATNAGTMNNPIFVQGGLLYNSGTIHHLGVGSSGAPTVAYGGILINNGTLGDGTVGGDILYVGTNGVFEDLGGTASIKVQSVTVAGGGTFIPGGDGIGTTTITGDGTSTYPGAVFLAQGSTNIFKADAATSAHTVLAAPYVSFGGSSSQRSQNGCTLAINNTSLTLFSAGQSFHLFDNTFSSGSVPFSTGTSTNTYPIIIPGVPGNNLTWDYSPLWATGDIAIVGPGTGPVLTNSFGGDGTGTNIVGQFSWDSSKLGYRLETLVVPLSVGLAPNTNYSWTGVSGSWTNTAVTITNVIGTNSVFYRLSFP